MKPTTLSFTVKHCVSYIQFWNILIIEIILILKIPLVGIELMMITYTFRNLLRKNNVNVGSKYIILQLSKLYTNNNQTTYNQIELSFIKRQPSLYYPQVLSVMSVNTIT